MHPIRKATVSYRYQQLLYGSKRVPEIRIGGQWLKELDFDSGQKLHIQCEKGRIVIALQPDDDCRA